MPDAIGAAPFSSRDLRDQFGLFPTGVAVVTAEAREGIRLGATVSSFTSVSLEPPLVSFNIAKTSKAYDLWAGIEAFAVNVLAEEQSELSTRFARAGADKWDGLVPRAGPAGNAPLLPGALAWFACLTHATVPAGDHLILLGEVKALGRSSVPNARPLLFFASRYRRLDHEHPIDTPYDASMWLPGW